MKRNYGIDIAKTIAIICVIAIHISGPLFSLYDFNSSGWIISLIMGSMVRCAVPLFLMCSGALLMDPQKDLNMKKLFLKTIPRIIAAMIFWGMVYKIYHLNQADALSVTRIIHAFKEVLLFNQEYHFYYMHIILIVYIMLPVARVFVKNASKRIMEYSLIVWFLFAVIMPTAVQFYPFNMLSGLTYQWSINMTYASIGYGVLGYYLKTYPPRNIINIILTVSGYAVILAGTYYMSMKNGFLNEVFFSGMSVGSALMTCGIYGMCTNCSNCTNRMTNIVCTYVSKASFCIYLVHVLFISILSDKGYNASIMNPVISVPVFTMVILIMSIAVYMIISHIPVLRKWIV